MFQHEVNVNTKDEEVVPYLIVHLTRTSISSDTNLGYYQEQNWCIKGDYLHTLPFSANQLHCIYEGENFIIGCEQVEDEIGQRPKRMQMQEATSYESKDMKAMILAYVGNLLRVQYADRLIRTVRLQIVLGHEEYQIGKERLISMLHGRFQFKVMYNGHQRFFDFTIEKSGLIITHRSVAILERAILDCNGIIDPSKAGAYLSPTLIMDVKGEEYGVTYMHNGKVRDFMSFTKEKINLEMFREISEGSFLEILDYYNTMEEVVKVANEELSMLPMVDYIVCNTSRAKHLRHIEGYVEILHQTIQVIVT